MSKNIIIVGLIAVLLAGGFFAFRKGNPTEPNKKTGQATEKSSEKDKKGSVKLLTAKEAWEKVKPEADKWSSNYKIARISDIDTPSHQRIDGVSLGWKFYLEECQEYFTGSSSNLCKEGKTRSFYYQADDIVGRDAGIHTDTEKTITSGRTAFDPEIWKIDSDEAQELAREAVGRERNKNEDFKMAVEASDGVPYWEIGRQCWIKGDRENCDSSNGYSAYVNIETGEVPSEKP